MAKDKFIGLSEKDKEALRRVLLDSKGRPQNPPGRYTPGTLDHEEFPTPDVYVARAPLSGIPASTLGGTGTGTGTGTQPDSDDLGYAECTIYRILGDDVDDPQLVPLVGVTRRVHNLSSSLIPAESWLIVARDKFGSWWVVEKLSTSYGPRIARVTSNIPDDDGYPAVLTTWNGAAWVDDSEPPYIRVIRMPGTDSTIPQDNAYYHVIYQVNGGAANTQVWVIEEGGNASTSIAGNVNTGTQGFAGRKTFFDGLYSTVDADVVALDFSTLTVWDEKVAVGVIGTEINNVPGCMAIATKADVPLVDATTYECRWSINRGLSSTGGTAYTTSWTTVVTIAGTTLPGPEVRIEASLNGIDFVLNGGNTTRYCIIDIDGRHNGLTGVMNGMRFVGGIWVGFDDLGTGTGTGTDEPPPTGTGSGEQGDTVQTDCCPQPINKTLRAMIMPASGGAWNTTLVWQSGYTWLAIVNCGAVNLSFNLICFGSNWIGVLGGPGSYQENADPGSTCAPLNLVFEFIGVPDYGTCTFGGDITVIVLDF